MSSFEQAATLLYDALRARDPRSLGRASLASLRTVTEGGALPTRRETPPRPSPSAPARTLVMEPRAEASSAPVPQVTPQPRPSLSLAERVRAAMATPSQPEPAPHTAPSPSPLMPASPEPSREEAMEALRQRVMAALPNEPLAHNRDKFVFGVGNVHAELMFVGEAPGADEEIAGEPFVGKAGQLLTKIIEAMGMTREQVYIGNILKWRPDMPPGVSGNRKPRPDEMAVCLPYLVEQINIIRPKCLVGLGATAMEGLIGATGPLKDLRGRWHAFKGIPLMATYHPAYLLRNQSISEKRKVWEDMLQVLELLGKPISAKQRGYFLTRP